MEELVLCYNKGCGQKFSPKDNKHDSCRYHPGVPVFHDALKGWSCCSRRSTDFTEFLNIPGCEQGEHSNVKPAEPEKKPVDTVIDLEPVSKPEPKVVKPIAAPMERPSADEPKVRLEMKVSDSLNQALANRLKQMTVIEADDKIDPNAVAKGASCKNNGCLSVYDNEDSNLATCTYHPGIPVFHEGMKYWSCCLRKTTDFNSFLSQQGCVDGKHVWKKKDDTEKKVVCRFDWHQTASSVTISFYAKVADPTKTFIEVNKVTAKINIVFDGGKSHFEKFFVLRGIIDPATSNVVLLGTKVELNLKKLEPGSWSSLELPAAQQNGLE